MWLVLPIIFNGAAYICENYIRKYIKLGGFVGSNCTEAKADVPMLKLFLAIYGPKLKVGVLIKGVAFERMNKLFHYEITICASIVARVHENMKHVGEDFLSHQIVEVLVASSNDQFAENTVLYECKRVE
ncbi:hypothetical protein DITRI_Ditri18aG0022900 [Diplodiscus trichospermus]